MIKITVAGALGRMGSTVLSVAEKSGDFEIVGAVEKEGHFAIGKTLQDLGLAKTDVKIVDNLKKAVESCDVIIDFTEPRSAFNHFFIARDLNKPIVIGTTGFTEKEMETIRSEKKIRAVVSPNMSVGINLMFGLARIVSKILKDYDIEIVEIHHRMKKDAPSGTALKLKDAIKESIPDIELAPVYGRYGITGERKNEIGILSLRGGDVIGEHTVYFFGQGERLEITHKATSRENFARGALRAAKWILSQNEGVYSMEDVLGLRELLEKIFS